LAPLEKQHAKALADAASVDPALYRWSPVPLSERQAQDYIADALLARDAGTAMPFVVIRKNDEAIVGSTRFFDIARWAWPSTHPRMNESTYDAVEIGYTWYTASAIRTAANTEAKLLMLTHAFEQWRVLRVCLHTDERNLVSRAAIERLGARFEGILRAHRLATDLRARDSARYSIIADEWPAIKERLGARMMTAVSSSS
jgi:RimJ/RimL family protein N-acetyltransferase